MMNERSKIIDAYSRLSIAAILATIIGAQLYFNWEDNRRVTREIRDVFQQAADANKEQARVLRDIEEAIRNLPSQRP